MGTLLALSHLCFTSGRNSFSSSNRLVYTILTRNYIEERYCGDSDTASKPRQNVQDGRFFISGVLYRKGGLRLFLVITAYDNSLLSSDARSDACQLIDFVRVDYQIRRENSRFFPLLKHRFMLRTSIFDT